MVTLKDFKKTKSFIELLAGLLVLFPAKEVREMIKAIAAFQGIRT
jgi:hypothetical protein